NRMADRLVALRTDERELVADLSHRLRTPLTVLRLDAEALESDDTSIGAFSEAELDRRRGIRRVRQASVTLGGEVDQLIKESRRDGYVAIRIDDAGPGIANPDRALRRGASDQGSTGLGLDIAKRVALQANGSVSIDRAHLGGASVVMLLADPEATPRQVNRFG